MIDLEETLRPAAAPCGGREKVYLLIACALCAVLIPAWSGARIAWMHQADVVASQQPPDTSGEAEGSLSPPQGPTLGMRLSLTVLATARAMAQPALLAAMGFALALRYGVVDLSFYVVMSIGSVVAAGLIRQGLSPAAAFALAVLAGGVVGGVSGLLVGRLRWPGLLVTPAVAVAGIVALRLLAGGGPVPIPDQAFDGWVSSLARFLGAAGGVDENSPQVVVTAPLSTLEMILVAGAWALTMLGLLVVRDHQTARPSRRSLLWVLVLSGALYGLAGACRLLPDGQAIVAGRLLDDFDIPVAAILAGAVFLVGRDRTLLVGVLLPPALLVANIWRLEVWPIQSGGFSLHLLVLMAMVGLVQLALLWARPGTGRPRRLAAWLPVMFATAGLMLLAGWPWWTGAVRDIAQWAALGLGSLALACLGIPAGLAARRATAAEESSHPTG